jgi:hypothetical protein
MLLIGDREKLTINLKICGSQTNLQQFSNGFGLQGRPFHQSFMAMEFITDDLQGLCRKPARS